MKQFYKYCLGLPLLFTYSNAFALPIEAGNLLIITNDTLFEHSLDGTEIQSFSIPDVDAPFTSGRDLTFDMYGNVHVYNGTFDPHISTLSNIDQSWESTQIPGWDTVNNASYGGIDSYGDFVFATDMTTFGDTESELNGIVRYNQIDGTHQRFATDIEPIDLTVGLDGLLYALYPGGSPEGRFISVYNPTTMAHIRDISLADTFGHTGHRSIAVDFNGDIYIADWDSQVHHITGNGDLIESIEPMCDWIGRDIGCNFYDIDISSAGDIALGSRFGEVFLTDTDFSFLSTFDVGTQGIFVEFADVRWPSEVSAANAFSLFSVGLLSLYGLRRRSIK